MTDLTYTAPTAGLTAAGDTESRRVYGTIVPYGTPGHTSLGTVTIRAGAITLPDRVTLRLTYGHDQNRPIGVALELDDNPDRLAGSFAIARTPDGDAYLAEMHPDTPIRNGFSVDLVDVELAGSEVIAGTLAAVAAVPIPAYPTARAALAAEHTPPESESSMETLTATDTATAPDPTPAVPEPARPLEAAHHSPARTRPVSAMAEVARQLTAARMRGNVGGFLSAALADITPAGNGAGQENAGMMTQALGELWDGVGYSPKYTGLIGSGALTGTTVTGFRWNPPPTVADYAGNKGPVPSNAAKLESVLVSPTRLAGAHDIDRIYKDLGDAAVLRSYWEKMTESLAVQLDARALDLIEAAAGAPVAHTGTALSAVITGTFEVGKVGTPTVAIVSGDLLLSAALTPANAAPVGGFVTLPPIVPGPDLAPGTVIVLAKSAARLLTFSPPIRVEAVNIPNGGIDGGLFSYSASLVENAAAAVAYTVTAPVVAGVSDADNKRAK